MTQPAALYIADILEDAGKPADVAEKAAAELRRLHAELERCKQVCAATSEGWRADAEKWKDQRAVLLEALNRIVAIENQMFGSDWEEIDEAREIARAAIAKAEGQQ